MFPILKLQFISLLMFCIRKGCLLKIWLVTHVQMDTELNTNAQREISETTNSTSIKSVILQFKLAVFNNVFISYYFWIACVLNTKKNYN